MAKDGAAKDNEAKAWAKERLTEKSELAFFLGCRYGLAIIIEEDQDPEWVAALIARSASSRWIWDLLVSVYDLYRRDNAALPPALQQWVDDVVNSRIMKPTRNRGRQVDEGEDELILVQSDFAWFDGLTQEQFITGRAKVKKLELHTCRTQISRARRRVRNDPLWELRTSRLRARRPRMPRRRP